MVRPVLLTAIVATTFAAPAAFDPVQAVPANYEVIVSLNSRTVIDSAVFTKVWGTMQKPQTKAQLAVLQAVTGVDVMKDISRVVFFSRVNDDASVGVIFEGKFDETKLLMLVQANDTYKTTSTGGKTIHEWFDAGEQKTKFAWFPDAKTVGIWNSRAALDASLGAVDKPGTSFAKSPDAIVIPTGDFPAWGVLVTRQTTCPGAKLRIANATMTMDVAKDPVAVRLTVLPESPAIAEYWFDMAKGAKALALLQRDNPQLSTMAEGMTVTRNPDNVRVDMTASLTADEIIAFIQQQQAAK